MRSPPRTIGFPCFCRDQEQFSVVALALAIKVNHMSAFLALSVAGAAAGFLIYNFYPARIFMGDSGSLFLGFALATVAVMSSHKSTATVAILVPLAALAVPLADTGMAILRRTIHHRPLFQGDDAHVHHKLLLSGLGPRQSAIFLYLMTGACGFVAVSIATWGWEQGFLLTTILGFLLLVVMRSLGILDLNVSIRLRGGEYQGPDDGSLESNRETWRSSTDLSHPSGTEIEGKASQETPDPGSTGPEEEAKPS